MPFTIIGDRIEYKGHHVATLVPGAPATVVQDARDALSEYDENDEREQDAAWCEEVTRLEEELEACRSKRKAYAALLMVNDDDDD